MWTHHDVMRVYMLHSAHPDPLCVLVAAEAGMLQRGLVDANTAESALTVLEQMLHLADRTAGSISQQTKQQHRQPHSLKCTAVWHQLRNSHSSAQALSHMCLQGLAASA